jgi:type I restriction enzyme S subunit
VKFPLLSEILEFTRDGEWGKGEPANGLVKMGVIRGTDFDKVRRGDLSTIPIRYIPKKAAERKTLRPRDILFETAGGTKDQPTGRSVFLKAEIFDEYPYPLTCASFSRFLRVNDGSVSPEYLFWYLQYLWSERLIYQYHIQHTGVARFQYTLFASEQTIPVLGRVQQDSITGLLGALDDKIELNRKMAATLEEMARALYRSWFVDFDPVHAKAQGRAPVHMDPTTADLFPDRFGEDGLPEGWEMRSIYEFAQVQYGAAFKSSLFNTKGEGRPLVRIRDLKNHAAGVYTTETHKKEHLIQSGDTVVGMDGDFTSYTWCNKPALMNQRVCSFLPRVAENRSFVRHGVVPQLKAEEEAAVATTVIHLGKKDIDKFVLPAPSVEVLEAFSSLVEPLTDRFVKLGLENITLAQLRDTLIPKLMSGELRIREAEKQIEEVV